MAYGISASAYRMYVHMYRASLFVSAIAYIYQSYIALLYTILSNTILLNTLDFSGGLWAVDALALAGLAWALPLPSPSGLSFLLAFSFIFHSLTLDTGFSGSTVACCASASVLN